MSRRAGVMVVIALIGLLPVPVSRADAQTSSANKADESGARDFAGALLDSFKLVMFEHVTRIAFQAKTRDELGAAAGIVWLDHSDKDRAASIFSPGYLASRGRAAAFSAIYSVQFEIGPLSEASIGNVGLKPETAGWVDYIATPVGAFGFMIAEDALDRYHYTLRAGGVSIRARLAPIWTKRSRSIVGSS